MKQILNLAKTKIEPCTLVKLYLSDGIHQYTDKNIDLAIGKILSINNFDFSETKDNKTSVNSISITVEDSNLVLKDIMLTNRLLNQKVEIYQYYNSNNLLLMITGTITTPLEWSEEDRSLVFNVIEGNSKTFDYELDNYLTGEEWDEQERQLPLIFGTIIDYPSIKIKEPFKLTTIEPCKISFDLTNIENPIIFTESFKVENANLYGDFACSIVVGNVTLKGRFSGDSFYVSEAFPTLANIKIKEKYPNKYKKSDPDWPAIPIETEYVNYIDVDLINDRPLSEFDTSKLINKVLVVQQQLLQTDEKRKILEPRKNLDYVVYSITDYKIIDGNLRLYLDTPMYDGSRDNPINNLAYLKDAGYGSKESLSLSGEVQVIDETRKQVWVANSMTSHLILDIKTYIMYNTQSRYLRIDPNTNEYSSDGNILETTYAENGQILVSLPNAFYSAISPDILENKFFTTVYFKKSQGQIYTTIVNNLNNLADVIAYLLTTYTDIVPDTNSFAAAHDALEPYPVNMVIEDKVNVVEFCSTLAWEGRCSFIIKDKKAYLKFLPDYLSGIPVFIFNNSNIEEASIRFEYDDAEDLVTNLVGRYVSDWKSKKITLVESNVGMGTYGSNRQERDFHIYQDVLPIQKTLTFWSKQTAVQGLKITLKTFPDSAGLEIFDIVHLDTELIVCDAMVIKIEHDTSTSTLSLTLRRIELGQNVADDFSVPSQGAKLRKHPYWIEQPLYKKQELQNIEDNKVIDAIIVTDNTPNRPEPSGDIITNGGLITVDLYENGYENFKTVSSVYATKLRNFYYYPGDKVLVKKRGPNYYIEDERSMIEASVDEVVIDNSTLKGLQDNKFKEGQLVLVKGQDNRKENGPYIVRNKDANGVDLPWIKQDKFLIRGAKIYTKPTLTEESEHFELVTDEPRTDDSEYIYNKINYGGIIEVNDIIRQPRDIKNLIMDDCWLDPNGKGLFLFWLQEDEKENGIYEYDKILENPWTKKISLLAADFKRTQIYITQRYVKNMFYFDHFAHQQFRVLIDNHAVPVFDRSPLSVTCASKDPAQVFNGLLTVDGYETDIGDTLVYYYPESENNGLWLIQENSWVKYGIFGPGESDEYGYIAEIPYGQLITIINGVNYNRTIIMSHPDLSLLILSRNRADRKAL